VPGSQIVRNGVNITAAIESINQFHNTTIKFLTLEIIFIPLKILVKV
jgi:hypothetical protein